MPISNILNKIRIWVGAKGSLPKYLFGTGKAAKDEVKEWGLAKGTVKGLGRAAYVIGKNVAKVPVAFGEALYKYPKVMVPTTIGLVAGGKHLYDNHNAYLQHVDPRYDTTQNNGLFRGISMRKEANWLETAGQAVGHGTTLLGGAMLAGNYINKFISSGKQEQLIKTLSATDPIIKNADPAQVMSFYKTICNMAPKVSLDENAVKDLMHNFIKFGRIDMQSLKLLVETEKLFSEARKNSFGGRK